MASSWAGRNARLPFSGQVAPRFLKLEAGPPAPAAGARSPDSYTHIPNKDGRNRKTLCRKNLNPGKQRRISTQRPQSQAAQRSQRKQEMKFLSLRVFCKSTTRLRRIASSLLHFIHKTKHGKEFQQEATQREKGALLFL